MTAKKHFTVEQCQAMLDRSRAQLDRAIDDYIMCTDGAGDIVINLRFVVISWQQQLQYAIQRREWQTFRNRQ